MQAPLFTHQELIEFLAQHGWTVCSDEYWERFDRLILKKGDVTFPMPLHSRYLFPFVVKLCISLGIEAPADHKKNFDQLTSMRHRELAKRLAGEKKPDDQ
ncbi:MAG: hypothetical protein JST66_01335 [Bacteroidetes bacterium]|nr:hypothetical protein [Bacteroidota bacterium]